MAPSDHDCQHTRDHSETPDTRSRLVDLLSNTLILHQTVPYLPILSVLNVAATSKSFRGLLQNTPGVSRHLDLTRIKSAQFDIDAIDRGGEIWRNVQLDENLTEDDFYSGPLRGIMSSLRRRNVLQDVRTLILDGLSVTSEFCHEILVDPSLRIHILSLREVKNLNERKLMQSLRFACRSTRADDMPRLRGLYIFGKRDVALGPEKLPDAHEAQAAQSLVTSRGADISVSWNQKSHQTLKETIENAGEDWYSRKGRMISKHIANGWAETLMDCRESLSFDAPLCTGPRHQNSPAFGKAPVDGNNIHAWRVATFALGGCASCGSSPEGFTTYGESRTQDLPLLSPVPSHSSSMKAATCPKPDGARDQRGFVPRCLECIRERYCFSCDQWWCEACYQVPSRGELSVPMQSVQIVDQTNGLLDHELAALEPPKVKPTSPKITRSCWECEHNCLDCIAETQKLCQACGGGYCIIHYDGSTATLCDWCSMRRGRRSREMH